MRTSMWVVPIALLIQVVKKKICAALLGPHPTQLRRAAFMGYGTLLTNNLLTCTTFLRPLTILGVLNGNHSLLAYG